MIQSPGTQILNLWGPSDLIHLPAVLSSLLSCVVYSQQYLGFFFFKDCPSVTCMLISLKSMELRMFWQFYLKYLFLLDKGILTRSSRLSLTTIHLSLGMPASLCPEPPLQHSLHCVMMVSAYPSHTLHCFLLKSKHCVFLLYILS